MPRDGGVYIDGTFGAGGYTRAHSRSGGLPRDRHRSRPERDRARRSIWSRQSGGRLDAGRGRFSDLESVARELGHDAVDGVVLDLGVSSMQLDEAERGFSFRLDGPLDMRMGGDGPSAADLVAQRVRARSRHHHRDARRGAACARRRPRDRAGARRDADPYHARARRHRRRASCARKPGEIHPATRTFQALRMFVNEELGELADALRAAERMLEARRAAGGGLVPFARRPHRQDVPHRARPRRAGSRHPPDAAHARAELHAADRRPVVADDAEIAANPRARSAKLRAAERTDAPPSAGDSIASAAAPAVARRGHEGGA